MDFNWCSEKRADYNLLHLQGAVPIETYLCQQRKVWIKLVPLRHQAHALEELKVGNLSKRVAALDQEMLGNAAAVFIWTAVFERSKWKYKQRAYRYVYLDVGHVAQNLALAATSIGLGSCQIGAFFDDEINQILNIDGKEESVIYFSIVGHPK
jgi:SagB-type dehydrogenase family enzyme